MVGFPADRKLSQINVDFSSLCNSFELEPEQKAQWAISSALKLKKKKKMAIILNCVEKEIV